MQNRRCIASRITLGSRTALLDSGYIYIYIYISLSLLRQTPCLAAWLTRQVYIRPARQLPPRLPTDVPTASAYGQNCARTRSTKSRCTLVTVYVVASCVIRAYETLISRGADRRLTGPTACLLLSGALEINDTLES